MKKIIETIQTKYGVRRRVALRFTEDDVSMTDQSFKKECDINNIVAKFKKTRDPSLLKQRQGVYADVSEYGDLSDAYMKVQNAEEAFATVPAALRAKLDNDPVKFIQYMNDPNNIEEAVQYGIMSRKESKSDSSLSTEPVKEKSKSSKQAQKPTSNEDEE